MSLALLLREPLFSERPLRAASRLGRGRTSGHPLRDCPRVALKLARSTILPSLGCRDRSLRTLRRWGNGVRRRRGEVEELLRERRDEGVDDRLHRHQAGGPPLLVHHGDMPVGAAMHLV